MQIRKVGSYVEETAQRQLAQSTCYPVMRRIDSSSFYLVAAQIKYGAAILRAPPTRRAIEIGIEKGLFPPSAISAYHDFMGLRNKIAHDYAFQVDNATILSLISLGTELLKVLSTEKSDG